MPRFYFDVYNDVSTLDDAGSDLADIETARGVALDVLSDLTPHFPANGAVGRHRVIVRGQSGECVLEAVLTYQCVMMSDEEN